MHMVAAADIPARNRQQSMPADRGTVTQNSSKQLRIQQLKIQQLRIQWYLQVKKRPKPSLYSRETERNVRRY